jgi:hypothetical protein
MLEQQGLAFDQIILRPEGKKLGSPSQFKAKWVKNLLKRLKMSKGKEAMAEVRASFFRTRHTRRAAHHSFACRATQILPDPIPPQKKIFLGGFSATQFSAAGSISSSGSF